MEVGQYWCIFCHFYYPLLPDDSTIANKLMTDFSNFCSNKDGLLEKFWMNNHRRNGDISEHHTDNESTV